MAGKEGKKGRDHHSIYIYYIEKEEEKEHQSACVENSMYLPLYIVDVYREGSRYHLSEKEEKALYRSPLYREGRSRSRYSHPTGEEGSSLIPSAYLYLYYIEREGRRKDRDRRRGRYRGR